MSKAPGSKPGKAKTPTKPAASKKPVKAALGKSPALAKSAVSKPSGTKGKPVKVQPKAAVKPLPVKAAIVKGPAAKPLAAKTSAAKPIAIKAAPPAKAGPKDSAARTIATAKPAAPKKTEGVPKKMAPRVKITDIVLPPNYRPSDDEPFMNDMHRAYFRKRLLEWKEDILRQTRETIAILHEDSSQHADLADRATSETDRATELRTRDRQRKLVSKIDAAVARIDDGSYGYCEDTGEPIGLKRLDARPIATLSVEAQERHERREKVYREE